MKKITVLLIVLSSFSIEAQSVDGLSVRVGVGSLPTNVQGFEDFHISDWQDFGLGGGEGRVLVDLSSEKPKSSFNIHLGAYYDLSEKLQALIEVNAAFSGATALQGLLGVNYNFISTDRVKIGIGPKIGATYTIVNLGEIKIIDGYSPPVIIEQGTFRDGDNIEMSVLNINIQAALNVELLITDNIGLFGTAYYLLGIGNEVTLEIADVELDLEDKAIVKTDGSSTQADVSPKFKTEGLGFNAGISYRF